MRQSFRRYLLSAFVVVVASGACLNASDILQPELTIVPGAPEGWTSFSQVGGIGTTITVKRSGGMSAYLSSAGQQFPPNYLMVQYVRADNYRGKRMQLSAWFKPRNVTGARYSGLWMRIDGPGTVLSFDDMASRVVSGNSDWRRVSIVLDVPADAIGISLGVQFQAYNTVLVDDITLTEVAATVASTNLLTVPVSSERDSAATVALYQDQLLAPVNLNFESVSTGGGAGGRSTVKALTHSMLNTTADSATETLRDRVRRTMR